MPFRGQTPNCDFRSNLRETSMRWWRFHLRSHPLQRNDDTCSCFDVRAHFCALVVNPSDDNSFCHDGFRWPSVQHHLLLISVAEISQVLELCPARLSVTLPNTFASGLNPLFPSIGLDGHFTLSKRERDIPQHSSTKGVSAASNSCARESLSTLSSASSSKDAALPARYSAMSTWTPAGQCFKAASLASLARSSLLCTMV